MYNGIAMWIAAGVLSIVLAALIVAFAKYLTYKDRMIEEQDLRIDAWMYAWNFTMSREESGAYIEGGQEQANAEFENAFDLFMQVG